MMRKRGRKFKLIVLPAEYAERLILLYRKLTDLGVPVFAEDRKVFEHLDKLFSGEISQNEYIRIRATKKNKKEENPNQLLLRSEEVE